MAEITRRALISRIQTALAKHDQTIHSARSAADLQVYGLGAYIVTVKATGAHIQAFSGDGQLMAWAREQNIVKPAETLSLLPARLDGRYTITSTGAEYVGTFERDSIARDSSHAEVYAELIKHREFMIKQLELKV
jgi:hypothetical protein